MAPMRRIRTILYGDERIEGTELDLIRTPAPQRLYDLHQLGLTSRVYLDASHSRLHHVIGVLYQVDNLVTSIARNLKAKEGRTLKYYDADGKTPIERSAGAMARYVQ